MRTTKLLLLAGLALPSVAVAQLPITFNPRSIALGGAYTSLARGWEAALSNPAMLAAVGNPSFTIGLPSVNVETGSNAYSFSDIRRYANATLDSTSKAYLLHQVTKNADSALTLRTIFGAAPFGISLGRFALATYTTGNMDLSMGADAVELALYGNAHRSGPGQFFTAHGTGMNGWAASVIAGSLAMPVSNTPMGRLTIGATYKKVLGHAMATAGELSSHFQVNPQFTANVAGQAIYTDEGGNNCGNRKFSLSASSDPCSLNAGAGYGVDLGAVLQRNGRGTTYSFVITNALGSMTWDPSRLVYARTVDSVVQVGNNVRDTSISHELRGAALNADPIARAMRDSVLKNANFSQVVRVGAAFRKGMGTITFGGSLRLKQGMDNEPSQTVSAGAELRLLHIIPIRAGVSSDLGSSLVLSAGSGIQFLGINLDASIAAITGSTRPGVIVGAGASLIW